MKDDTANNFEIIKEETVYDGFLKVIKAQVKHDTWHGNEQLKVTRESLERGDSVAILLYEQDTKSFLFTKQFRYPSARRGKAFMMELVAGSLGFNEDPVEGIKREVEEEIGYSLKNIEKICSYFPSPGGCSEQIHLYFSQVSSHDKIFQGGGEASEKEDILLTKIPLSEIKQLLRDGAINNSISIIGLQWFLLNKESLT
ncbi:NUDIX domain-containing protein [Nonlabens sp. SY33080]|uniref:NUDIX domain-containing protein n=1 Tax=Nonlabens sp. SY33080 TaxID=2719911 RepID=UPI001428CE88|nr:NUDIX domain-containing protein [Nonlabens sp. SY33080]